MIFNDIEYSGAVFLDKCIEKNDEFWYYKTYQMATATINLKKRNTTLKLT